MCEMHVLSVTVEPHVVYKGTLFIRAPCETDCHLLVLIACGCHSIIFIADWSIYR